MGAFRINLSEVVALVDVTIHKLCDSYLTSISRFLCSLDRDGNLDGGIAIDQKMNAVMGKRHNNFRRDISFAALALSSLKEFG
jgi:hypothetical protein